MLLEHRHAVLKVLDDVRRRLVGLAKGERHGGGLPRATRQLTVHLRDGNVELDQSHLKRQRNVNVVI